MRYINKLQEQNQQQSAQITAVYNRMIELENYLLSPKFYDDSKVEKQDILNRLHDMRSILLGYDA